MDYEIESEEDLPPGFGATPAPSTIPPLLRRPDPPSFVVEEETPLPATVVTPAIERTRQTVESALAQTGDTAEPFINPEAKKRRAMGRRMRKSPLEKLAEQDITEAGGTPFTYDIGAPSLVRSSLDDSLEGRTGVVYEDAVRRLREQLKTTNDPQVRAAIEAQLKNPKQLIDNSRAAVQHAGSRGMSTGELLKQPGFTESTFDFDRAREFRSNPLLSNPLSRGVAQGATELWRGAGGFATAVYDLAGFDTSDNKRRLKELSQLTEEIGTGNDPFSKNMQGAISSIVQQLPFLAGGAVAGGTKLALGGMAGTVFGQEYDAGTQAGLTGSEAAARASTMAAFEVIGESFGLGGWIERIRKAGAGIADPGELAQFLASQLSKEIPGELLTTTGQFLADKYPGFGLNPQAGFSEYLQAAGDTVMQTVMQGGVMAGTIQGFNSLQGRTTAQRARRADSAQANAMQKANDLLAGRKKPSVAPVADVAPAAKKAPPARVEPTISDVEIQPSASEPTIHEAPAPDIQERRSDEGTRKRVEQMSPQELRSALLTNELSGLPNRRAYDEAPKKPVQASIDIDSLKYVNDTHGHKAGDALLNKAAEVLRSEGIEVFHISGDEFVAQGEDEQDLHMALERASEALASSSIELPLDKGGKKTVTGLGLSYGLGKDLGRADKQLQVAKTARQAKGERAGRGEAPPAAIEVVEQPRVTRPARATEKPAAGTTSSDAGTAGQDQAVADLQALQGGAASPEAITRLVNRKLAIQSETGAPRLLPAGRRLLSSASRGTSPGEGLEGSQGATAGADAGGVRRPVGGVPAATTKPGAAGEAAPAASAKGTSERVEARGDLQQEAPAGRRGVTRRIYRGTGRDDKRQVYNGAAVPILGKGKYYAFDRKTASTYGSQIEERDLDLKNPLVIDSDQAWSALTKKAGWKFPNPHGMSEAEISDMTARLQKQVRDQGHDGIVVDFNPKYDGDILPDGRGIKLLNRVFDSPQVVYFGDQESDTKKNGEQLEQHEVAGQKISVNTNPTDEQRRENNYTKGRVKFEGLDINIENPKGTSRKYVDPDGKPGTRVMQHHYGERAEGTGADGDKPDVFIVSDEETGKAFVINQINPKTGKFDETKTILGAETEQQAREAYLSNYQKNWKGLGSIHEMSIERYKEWSASKSGSDEYTPSLPVFNKTEVPLKEAISKSIAGTHREPVRLGVSPPFLRQFGFPQRQIIATPSVIKKLNEKHGLSPLQIEGLLRQINNSFLVFDSPTMPDSLVLVTPAKVRTEVTPGVFEPRHMVVALKLGTVHPDNPNSLPVIVLESAYGRKDEQDFVRWINNGKLVGADREPALRWLPSSSEQYQRAHQSITQSKPLHGTENGGPRQRPVLRTGDNAKPEPSNIREFMAEFRKISYENPINPRERLIGRGQTDRDWALLDITPWMANETVHLSSIQSLDQGKRTGAGSYALKRITDLADKHGVTISLHADKFGNVPGSPSTTQLRKWYERNGFVRANGSEQMVREPNGLKNTRPVMSKQRREQPPSRDFRQVYRRVAEMVRPYSAANVMTYRTEKDLPPQILNWLAQNNQLNTGIKGFLWPDSGVVYVIADQHNRDTDLMETVYHELVGHYGLRSLMTAAKYEETMEGIWRDMPDMARAYAKRNGLDISDPDQRLHAAEEVVAYTAGKILSGQKPDAREMTVWQRVVEMFKDFIAMLRRKVRYNEKTIARIVSAASNHLKRAAMANQSELAMRPVFSQKPTLYYSKIWDSINSSKVPNAAPVTEYEKILQSKIKKDFGEEEWNWSGLGASPLTRADNWGVVLRDFAKDNTHNDWDSNPESGNDMLNAAMRYGAPTDVILKLQEFTGSPPEERQMLYIRNLLEDLMKIPVKRINKEYVLDRIATNQLTVKAVPYATSVVNQSEIDAWLEKYDPDRIEQRRQRELQRRKDNHDTGHYRDATDEEREEKEEEWDSELADELHSLDRALQSTDSYADQSDYISERARERVGEDSSDTEEFTEKYLKEMDDEDFAVELAHIRMSNPEFFNRREEFEEEEKFKLWQEGKTVDEDGDPLIVWDDLSKEGQGWISENIDELTRTTKDAIEEKLYDYYYAMEEEYYHGGEGSYWEYSGTLSVPGDGSEIEVEITGSDDIGYTVKVDGDQVGAEFYSRRDGGVRRSGHELAIEAALEKVREIAWENHMPDFSQVEISEEEARELGLIDGEDPPEQALLPLIMDEIPPKPVQVLEERPKWPGDSYNLPESHEYGERLFIPSINSRQFTHSHWPGRENVVAHVRFSTRDLYDGRKILFLEEMQSDWHQQYRDNSVSTEPPVKNWNSMIMKWAISHAIERGFDGVGLSNGAVHGVRWSATQSYKEATIEPLDGDWMESESASLALKTYDFDPKYGNMKSLKGWSDAVRLTLYAASRPRDSQQTVLGETGVMPSRKIILTTKDRLEGIIGRDAARKYLELKDPTKVDLKSGDGLVIWGPTSTSEATFRRHFGSIEIYDKIAINEINGFLKKFDARLEFQDMKIGFSPVSKGLVPGKSGPLLNSSMADRVKQVLRNKIGIATGQTFLDHWNFATALSGMPDKQSIHPDAYYLYDIWEEPGRKGGFWVGTNNLIEANTAALIPQIATAIYDQHPKIVEQAINSGLVGEDGDRGSARIPVVFINAKLDNAAKNTGFPLFSKREADGLTNLGAAIRQGSNEFELPDPTLFGRKWNYLRYKVQDKYIDLLNTQREVQRFREAVAIPESMDAYLKQELFHGKAEERIHEFEKAFEDPLIELIKKSGYEWQEISDYLYARHAPERNKRIREINPDDPSWGSGMTDERAAEVMRTLEARGDINRLKVIGAHVDRMTKWTRQTMVAEGLETAETIKAWEETYKHYVPLKGWADEEDAQVGPIMPRKGKGFDTGGKLTKSATGRKTLAGTILANIGAQARATLVLAEKAKVGRALYDFVSANPSSHWKIDDIQYTRYVDPSTGLVREGVNPNFKLADNVVRVKMDGKDQHITFDPKDERMLRLAAAIKNLSPDQVGPILAFMHRFNRYLSTISTSLNPEFVVTNALRDMQTALINLSEQDQKWLRTKVVRDWRKAARGIWLGERESKKNHEWKNHWERFKKAGAKVGWIDHYKTPVDLEKALQRKLGPANKAQWSMDQVRKVGKYIEHMNGSVENAIRLSVFVNLTAKGMNEERAASVAKNLTVNFNRRGDIGVFINSLYLFANASIQGTARFFQFAASPKGMRIMAMIVAAGVGMDMLNRFIGGDDDDGENRYDKISQSEKERNLIIMLPRKMNILGLSTDYIKIPMPYGYNVPYYMGSLMGKYVDFGFVGNARRVKPGEDAGSMLGAMMGSWSPIGDTTSIGQFVSPTLFDPFIQLDENRAWHGGKIFPDAPFDDSPPPDSQQAFDSNPLAYRVVAQWLNEHTGGTEVTPGAIDISPETMQHWVDFAGGGLARFVTSMIDVPNKLINDPLDLDVREIAFMRRVVGSIGSRENQELFYQHVSEIQYAKSEIDAIYKMGMDTEEAKQRLQFVSKKYPVATMLVREMYPSFASGRGDEDLDKAVVLRRLYEGIEPEKPVTSPARPRRGETASLVTKLSRARQEIRRLEARPGLPATERSELIKKQRDVIQQTITDFNKKWSEVHDSVYGAKRGRLIGDLGTLVEGKPRKEQVAALEKAGLPATASLIRSLPPTPDRLAMEYFTIDAARS